MAETVLISGASGMVGRALLRALRARGYNALKLVRHPPSDPDEILWKVGEEIRFPPEHRVDGVIHLAGESVFGIWSSEKKQRIRDSRAKGTRSVADFCATRAQKPRFLISASAVGFYGDRGDEILTETSASGKGFLAQVARDWEEASASARAAGIRVVSLRIGIVLGKTAGALRTMLPPFQLGLGGRVGSGKQWLSWIALHDLLNIIVFAVENTSISGPVNCVAPQPVTNAEFAEALGFVLNRPALLPLPAFIVKWLPGKMAEETMLASQRVRPQRLFDLGYKFAYPNLVEALKAELRVEMD